MQLAGKIAVVTGASSGIGAATATALADAGMTVVAVARRRERLEEMSQADPRIRPFPADVRDDGEVDALAAGVTSELGACHVLVNNAGLNEGKAFRGREDLDELHRVMDVNFFGAVRCMAAFADLLTASAPSRVVNVASVAGKVGAGMAGYGSSKFALVGLTENVRAHWKRKGVAVGQLNPGFIRTEGFPQSHLRGTPLDRLVGRPEDVASAIVAMARSGAAERTVPRWYRAAVVVRHVVPPVWRAASARF